MNKRGLFIISIDYESLWGAIGGQTAHDFDAHRARVKCNSVIIPRLLNLFEKYDIHATWATVGAMSCKTQDEVINHLQSDVFYKRWNLSLHKYIMNIKENDFHHFFNICQSELILKTHNQELASHTFTHLYCDEIEDDTSLLQQEISASISALGPFHSIVFPRNQVNPKFLQILKQNDIWAYRGNCTKFNSLHPFFKKIIYFANCYLPLFDVTYSFEEMKPTYETYNIKASLFYRTWYQKLSWLEHLKLWRIKLAMNKAARSGRAFHLWFHPHNLATNIEFNFEQLEAILKYYKELNSKYGFISCNMREVVVNVLDSTLHY